MEKAKLTKLECALWSSNDEGDESGGEPLDEHYGIDDFDAKALADAIEDCEDFQESNREDLEGEDLAKAGFHFWLTRNGHGAGFWDGDYEEKKGERLSEAAKVYGGVDLYVCDGKVWKF